MLSLNLQPNIQLIQDGESTLLLISLQAIEQQLGSFPPSELAWEHAIMYVEDGISPLRDALQHEQHILGQNAEELALLPYEVSARGREISTQTLETAFAVLAGYTPQFMLLNLPHTVAFAAKVLLMREWMHHLAFDSIILTDNA